MLQILSFVAQSERENGRRKVSPPQKRIKFGRTEVKIPADFGKIIRQWEHKQIPIDEAIKCCQMSEATFYRRLREY